MNTQEQNFITILKDALHPQEQLSVLSSPDWSQIFTIAAKQNLLPFVYNAAAEYDTFSEYDEAHPDVFVKATSVMSRQIQKTDAFLNLYRAFQDSRGTHGDNVEPPIVLKGIVCRSLYKDGQDFRTSGDEDLLVDEANFQRATSVLEECGYQREQLNETHTDVLQEVTFFNQEEGLAIELHINPLGRANDLLSEMNDWFKDVFERTEYVEILDTQIRVMQPSDEFLFLVLHMFKHFTSTGAGLRMAMDILLYMEKYYERIGWTYIWDKLNQVRAARYLADVIAMGNIFLGFKLPQKMSAVNPEMLAEDMIQSGVFGTIKGSASESDKFTQMAISEGGRGKVGSMFRMLFPSWKMWTTWRPYLKRKPWMLPVEWVKRVFRFIKSGKKVSVMTESLSVAEERMTLLRKYE